MSIPSSPTAELTPPIPLKSFVGGQWVSPASSCLSAQSYEASRVTLQYNPNTGVLQDYSVVDVTDEQVEEAIRFAVKGGSLNNGKPKSWASYSVEERHKCLTASLPRIEAIQADIARIDAVETGVHHSVTMNINDGLVHGAKETLDSVYAFLEAENGKSLEGRHGHPIKCARAPLTPVAIVAPWNVPCGTIIPKLIAALMCGCNVIIKPSERASTGIIRLVEAIMSADAVVDEQHANTIPPDALQLLTGGRGVGEALVSSPLIAAVQFTGASNTAVSIQVELSKKLRPFLAECGGSNAIIVTRKADLEHAAAAVVQGVTALNGQWCMGISRILVEASVRSQFVRVLQRAFRRRVLLAASDANVDELLHFVHAANAIDDAADAERLKQMATSFGGRSSFASNVSCGADGAAVSPTTTSDDTTADNDEEEERVLTSPALLRQPTESSIVAGISEELSIVGPMAFRGHAERLVEVTEQAVAVAAADKRAKEERAGTPTVGATNPNVLLLGRVYNPASPPPVIKSSPTTATAPALPAAMQVSGCFIQPRLIVNSDIDVLSRTELFGPAASLFEFNTIEEAMAMANKAEGQLCCYYFTGTDTATLAEAYNHCTGIHSGMVMINSIGFGFDVADGEVHPMGDFVGMAGSGADGNPEALARFFTTARWFGVNGSRAVKP